MRSGVGRILLRPGIRGGSIPGFLRFRLILILAAAYKAAQHDTCAQEKCVGNRFRYKVSHTLEGLPGLPGAILPCPTPQGFQDHGRRFFTA